MTGSLGRNMRVVAPVFVLLMVSGADRLEAGSTTDQQSPQGVRIAEVAVANAPVHTERARAAETPDPVSPLPSRAPHDGVKADLFRGHRWYVPPAPSTVRRTVAPVRREATAPPLPYKLLGIYEQAGSEPLYLLVNNDRIFEAAIGDTLEETYRVDGVSNGQLMLTYLPLQKSQGIRLGD